MKRLGGWLLVALALAGGAGSCSGDGGTGPVAGVLTVSLATLPGKAYFLQFRNSINDQNWTIASAVVGNGSITSISDSSAGAPRRASRG